MGGCEARLRGDHCYYVHPDEEDWGGFRSKFNVRCMVRSPSPIAKLSFLYMNHPQHFDNHGSPLERRCRNSSGACRFVHPDEVEWRDAEIAKSKPDSALSMGRSTGSSDLLSGRNTLNQHSEVAETLSTADAVRLSLPRLKTDTLQNGQIKASARPLAPSGSLGSIAKSNISKSITLNNSRFEAKHSSESTLGASPTSTRILQSPFPPTSAISQSIDGDKGVWKRRIAYVCIRTLTEPHFHADPVYQASCPSFDFEAANTRHGRQP